MTEQELKSIIKIVTDYFEGVSSLPAKMGMPYIKGGGDRTLDYTGLIGISGSRRGGVYYTAGKNLLREIGKYILNEEVSDDETLIDLAGEMTNTIAGNMREIFGSSFLISVPMVMKGMVEDISMKLKPPVFVIPIEWKEYPSQLVVGLE
jgi:chemotaxis protein CheX